MKFYAAISSFGLALGFSSSTIMAGGYQALYFLTGAAIGAVAAMLVLWTFADPNKAITYRYSTYYTKG